MSRGDISGQKMDFVVLGLLGQVGPLCYVQGIAVAGGTKARWMLMSLLVLEGLVFRGG